MATANRIDLAAEAFIEKSMTFLLRLANADRLSYSVSIFCNDFPADMILGWEFPETICKKPLKYLWNQI